MKVVFRVECNVGEGFVEITLDSMPFIPMQGMRIAPHPDADALEVDEVFWLASDPDTLEVWLVEDGDDVSSWAYFKKQGYKKGTPPVRSAA